MKDSRFRLKIWESAALAALCLALLAGTWAQGRQSSISSALLRLHVVAASDEREEQELKLRVRDAVLVYLQPVLRDAENSDKARTIINENLRGIAAAAARAAPGRKISVSLEREHYPTREYQGFTLPEGSYDSLRIVLDEGKGHNWWCIVFPPLCMDAAQAEQVQSVMSREDFGLVSGQQDCVLRFKILELWGKFTGACRDPN